MYTYLHTLHTVVSHLPSKVLRVAVINPSIHKPKAVGWGHNGISAWCSIKYVTLRYLSKYGQGLPRTGKTLPLDTKE